jgi:hypothetical protein
LFDLGQVGFRSLQRCFRFGSAIGKRFEARIGR